MPAARAPRLTASQREELADLKLVAGSVVHNCQAALIGEDLAGSLRTALVQAEQVAAGLRRIHAETLGTAPT